jgi:hypothetical protein
MANKDEIECMNIYNAEGLCQLAEMLGYGKGPINQLQCRNGAFVTSLLDFFNDNPGAIEAVQQFVVKNADVFCLDEEEEEELEEEENDD